MDATGLEFSRISKLFLDRDQILIEEALARRQNYFVTLMCGPDVEQSYTLQLAVLTATNIASRCFPGAVRIALESSLRKSRLLLWPSLELTFEKALARLVGPHALIDQNGYDGFGGAVVFGNADQPNGALRATFDGWIAKVGPASRVPRLPEREYCSVAGVLSAVLAISELFLSFAEINVEASHRITALSLWRPEADVEQPSALGVPVEFLPSELWILGLGHLGNAYLWTVATLPYADSGAVEIFLNDFDRVERENVETGVIFDNNTVGRYKTRVCRDWLEQLGFRTKLVERRFDSTFRCRSDEPRLALCGFDSNPARRDLATAHFLRVIESGLGGTATNFDTISAHTLPHPRKPEELWPDLTKEEEEKRIQQQESIAGQNPAYSRLAQDDCGRYELAGKAIAVPFVGATAASFVIAEAIRLLHGGPTYTDIKLRLGSPGKGTVQTACNYRADDCAGIKFSAAKVLELEGS